MAAPTPTITDNLVLNEDTVKERLAFFSKKKADLLKVLRQMRENAEAENGGQFTDEEKQTMAKCLGHYEMLSDMEDKYYETMNSIVGIRKNATDDFEAEQKDLRETLNESIVLAAAAKANGKSNEEEEKKEEGEGDESDSEDPFALLQKEMEEMVRMSDAVAKGQKINEQLTKRFQLLKEKRRIMQATREQKTAAQVKEELAAAGQYRSTRSRLSNESGQLDRKQKTLERLRKKVIERGMLAGAEAQQQLQEEVKQQTIELETSGLRVPVVDAEQKQEEDGQDDDVDHDKGAKPKSRIQRHKELKEKEAKEREEAAKREALIRESFVRLAARRDRMSAIKSQLETLSKTPLPAEEPEMKAVTIQDKLSELSKMREHLEKMQQSGSDFQDEEEFVQKLASLEASSEELSTAAEAPSSEAPDEEDAEDEDEVVREVRRHFENGLASSTCRVDDRLRCIEDALHRHQSKLNEIASQLQNMPPRCCQHCRYQPPTSASAILRHALLNATITQLQYFNDAVTRLTEGRSVAHLDQAINALFNAADPCLLRQDTITQDDTHSLCTSIALSHTPSPDYDPSRKASIESQSRAEEAKRQLCSGRAKLEKQRTLERIRTFTAKDEQQQLSPHRVSVSPRVSPKSTTTTSPLERDICLIMEAVLPWIKEHEADEVDETLVLNLSEVVLKRATSVALPAENRGAADRFDVQLSTILNSTLPQYEAAGTLGELRDQIVFEITDILYNELAFVQMMKTVDDVVVGLKTTAEA